MHNAKTAMLNRREFCPLVLTALAAPTSVRAFEAEEFGASVAESLSEALGKANRTPRQSREASLAFRSLQDAADPIPLIRKLQQLANADDQVAQRYLGFLFDNGFRVKQDSRRAHKLFSQAMSRDITSYFNMGLMEYAGRGVAENKTLGLSKITAAFNTGMFPEAAAILSILEFNKGNYLSARDIAFPYRRSRSYHAIYAAGVSLNATGDLQGSINILTEAARKGSRKAAVDLANYYREHSVDPAFSNAHYWSFINHIWNNRGSVAAPNEARTYRREWSAALDWHRRRKIPPEVSIFATVSDPEIQVVQRPVL